MKVKIDKAGPCRKSLKIEVPAEEVTAEFDKTTDAITKIAKVPGFRKGKAPRKIVESHFRKEIEEEVKDRMVASSYHAALKQENIDPVSVLALDNLTLAKGQPMSFSVTLDVPPEFKLPKYKGLTLKDKKTEVTDEDVDNRIKAVLDNFAKFEDTDRPVQKGDMAQVDFKATCEGKPLSELSPEAAGISETKDFWVMADENAFLPGFDTGLIGAAIGESREINVVFPQEIKIKELAGKTALFQVDVKAVREKKIPDIDEEFLKKINMESEASFREQIKKQLVEEADANENRRLKDEIINTLLAKTTMELPETLVQEETRHLLLDAVRHNMQRGISREDIEQQSDVLKSEAAKNASEKVKLGYILHKISEEEGLKVDDKEVDDFIAATAAQRNTPPADLRKEIEEKDELDSIKHQLRMNKTLDFILENAKLAKEGFLDKLRGS